MSESLREEVIRIMKEFLPHNVHCYIDYPSTKSNIGLVDAILSLFLTPLTEEQIYNIILETEANSDTRDWASVAHSTAIEIKKTRNNNFKRIREIASALIGKCGNNDNKELKAIKKIIANLDEFGHPIDPECELPLLATYVYGWIVDFYTQLCTAKNELSKALATPTFSGGDVRLHIICDFCHTKLTEPGALLFGIPNEKEIMYVSKRHLCKFCYSKLTVPGNSEPKRKKQEEFYPGSTHPLPEPIHPTEQNIPNVGLRVPDISIEQKEYGGPGNSGNFGPIPAEKKECEHKWSTDINNWTSHPICRKCGLLKPEPKPKDRISKEFAEQLIKLIRES